VLKGSAEDRKEGSCEQNDIHEIAKKRKNSFDFDLEVQGNKKSIRIKNSYTSKSSGRKKYQSL